MFLRGVCCKREEWNIHTKRSLSPRGGREKGSFFSLSSAFDVISVFTKVEEVKNFPTDSYISHSSNF